MPRRPLPPVTALAAASLSLWLAGCYVPGGGWTLRGGADLRICKKPSVFVEMVDTRWDEYNRVADENSSSSCHNSLSGYPSGGYSTYTILPNGSTVPAPNGSLPPGGTTQGSIPQGESPNGQMQPIPDSPQGPGWGPNLPPGDSAPLDSESGGSPNSTEPPPVPGVASSYLPTGANYPATQASGGGAGPELRAPDSPSAGTIERISAEQSSYQPADSRTRPARSKVRRIFREDDADMTDKPSGAPRLFGRPKWK